MNEKNKKLINVTAGFLMMGFLLELFKILALIPYLGPVTIGVLSGFGVRFYNKSGDITSESFLKSFKSFVKLSMMISPVIVFIGYLEIIFGFYIILFIIGYFLTFTLQRTMDGGYYWHNSISIPKYLNNWINGSEYERTKEFIESTLKSIFQYNIDYGSIMTYFLIQTLILIPSAFLSIFILVKKDSIVGFLR